MGKVLDFCNITGESVKEYEGERNYIATGDVVDNKIVSFEKVTYKNKPSRANQNVKVGDVLFAKMKDTQKVLIIDEENAKNIYSTGFFVITPKQDVKSKYLYWLFNSNKFNEQKNKNCKGATQKALNNEGFSKISIKVFPSIKEQEKIVDELDKVQKIIDIRNKQCKELDKLIKSQFDKMFCDKNFEKKEIRKLVNTNIIKTKKKFSNGEKIKYIDISAIDNEKNQVIGFNEFKIGEEPSRAQQCLEKNDILISTVRPNLKNIAVNKYNDNNIVGTSGFCVLRPEKCFVEYLLYVVLSEKFTNYMVSKTTGANYPAISDKDILDYKIEVPPIELQRQFAEFVELIDKQKYKIQRSLKEMKDLQGNLMNKYFSGE